LAFGVLVPTSMSLLAELVSHSFAAAIKILLLRSCVLERQAAGVLTTLYIIVI
jgi:hypothetical protein